MCANIFILRILVRMKAKEKFANGIILLDIQFVQ